MAYLSALGADATLLDVYRRYPDLARHALGLAQAAFAQTDELTQAECELLGAYVSSLNRCHYCRRIHSEAAVVCGLDRAVFGAQADGVTPDYGGAEWQPVFDYAKTLTLSPAEVTQQHVDNLLAAGWSQDAVAQVASVCCVFNVLNRLVDGLGLSADDEFFAAAGQRLAKVGYGGTAELLGLTGG